MNTSQLKTISALEFVHQDIHIKIQFVLLDVFQDSRITDLVDVFKSVLFQDVHSHTSLNKDNVLAHVMLVTSPTLLLEFVKLVARIVSHVCHQLSVPHVIPDSILKIIFVLLEPDVLEIN